jgi:hypothetical protein
MAFRVAHSSVEPIACRAMGAGRRKFHRGGMATMRCHDGIYGGMIHMTHGKNAAENVMANAHHTMLWSGNHNLDSGAGFFSKVGSFAKSALSKIANYITNGTAQSHLRTAEYIFNLGKRLADPTNRANMYRNPNDMPPPFVDKRPKMSFSDSANAGARFMNTAPPQYSSAPLDTDYMQNIR